MSDPQQNTLNATPAGAARKYTIILVLEVLVAQEAPQAPGTPYSPVFETEHWAVEMELKNGQANPFSLAQDYDQGWKHFVDNHLFIEDHKDEQARTVTYKPQHIHRESMLYRALPKFGFRKVPKPSTSTLKRYWVRFKANDMRSIKGQTPHKWFMCSGESHTHAIMVCWVEAENEQQVLDHISGPDWYPEVAQHGLDFCDEVAADWQPSDRFPGIELLTIPQSVTPLPNQKGQ